MVPSKVRLLYCIIQAYRSAPASVLAPFSDSSLVWAVLLGYLICDDVPETHVWQGATLIVASGLYILWREGVKKVEPAEPA